MVPTPRLRFIERALIPTTQSYDTTQQIRKVRILQQYYIPEGADRTEAHYLGEWRDVPLETE